MPRRRSHDSLMPPGLSIDHVEIGGTEIVVIARSRAVAVSCPDCGRVSTRIHSRYRRCLADLPAHGRRVRIILTARRFRCGSLRCPRKILGERFDEDTRTRAALRACRVLSTISVWRWAAALHRASRDGF